jgi:Ca2+-binding RTX toxin-like protein
LAPLEIPPMSTSWWNRLTQTGPRPAPRGRRGRAARPRFEGLEQRLALSVSATITGNGQLLVTDTSAADVVTLDHSGSTTLVNGISFVDSLITNGILMQVGSGVGNLDTVNILATVRPVTVDGQADVGTVNLGKAGSVQGIQAPVTLTNLGAKGFTFSPHGYDLNIDDSADPTGRTVTMTAGTGVATISNLAQAPINFDESGLDNLTINGGRGADTFNVLNTPADLEIFGISLTTTLINAGDGNDTINVFATSSILTVDGQAGGSQVHIGNGGSVQSITDLIRVFDTGGFTTLFVDDSADAVARNVTLNVTAAGGGTIEGLTPDVVSFATTGINFVSIKGGRGGNTFTVEDTFRNGTTSNITQIDTGTGTDQVFVHRSTGNLEINGQSGGDIVNIGSDFFPGGSLQGILGNVTITNQFSRSILTVNGAADAFDRTVTLAASSTLGEIRGLAPGVIFYTPNDVSRINLNGGNGRDTFFVTSTASPAPLQINGLGGNDTFIVGNSRNTLDDILTPLTLNGNSGFDTLIVNDQGSTVGHFYGVTATTVTRQIGTDVTINYAGIDSLQLNKSPVPITFGHDPFFPPQVKNLAFPQSIRVGQLANLTGRLVDQNQGDTLSLTVDWGDGSAPTVIAPGRKPFHLKHKYAAAGTYTARAIWTDSTGQSNFRDLALTVSPAPAHRLARR